MALRLPQQPSATEVENANAAKAFWLCFPGLPAVCAWNVGCNKSTLGSNEVLLCIRGDERALFRAQTALETTLGKWLAQAT